MLANAPEGTPFHQSNLFYVIQFLKILFKTFVTKMTQSVQGKALIRDLATQSKGSKLWTQCF